MTGRAGYLVIMLSGVLGACGGGEPPGSAPDSASAAAAPRGFEPPVLINGESPIEYPPTLYRERAEGTVILRLFVTADGTIVPDSARVAESSGAPALDSAALAGVARMQFVPARRDGTPVATTFLQPVHFRHPAGTPSGGGP